MNRIWYVVSWIIPANRPARSPSQRAASAAMNSELSTVASNEGRRTAHSASVRNRAIEAAIIQCVSGGFCHEGWPPTRGISQSPVRSISRAGSAKNAS